MRCGSYILYVNPSSRIHIKIKYATLNNALKGLFGFKMWTQDCRYMLSCAYHSVICYFPFRSQPNILLVYSINNWFDWSTFINTLTRANTSNLYFILAKIARRLNIFIIIYIYIYIYISYIVLASLSPEKWSEYPRKEIQHPILKLCFNVVRCDGVYKINIEWI